jgi:dihydroxyacetone kinase
MMTSPNKPKKILNSPEAAVSEFISGLLLQYPNKLVKLENQDVILNANLNPAKVQLLSGGGSGHEPSHAGWVGGGMLSGAIAGGMFASPSASAVLSAIRAVASDNGGVLLIVKNYTGDRLNFGMACEKANMEGIQCRMVVVADDVAIPRKKGITGARGVAGTVLVHKVAGAAAAKGYDLEKVVQCANMVTSRMGTLGVAIDAVTVPGAETVNDRLDAHTIEIGLGIHGEAGMRQSPLLTSNEIAKDMISEIQEYGKMDGSEVVPMMQKGDELCVLVNNLGGTSNFEMSILANDAVKILENDYGCKVTRLFVGSYMTSFDMHGASLTILNLAGAPDELKQLLDAPTDAPAWHPCDVLQGDRPKEMPEVTPKASDTDAAADLPPVSMKLDLASLVKAAASALADAEPLLTKYDTIVGDGDCGITMKRGATGVLEQMDKGNLVADHPVTLCAGLADAVSDSMGGTSGVLLELFFRKMSSTLSRASSIGKAEMCEAFEAGVNAISLYGGAKAGSRTMLDALFPAAATLVETQSLQEAAAKAREGADSTAAMKSADAGRSNYLSEETLEGTPDPGACAAAIVLEALAKESS